MRKLLVVLLVSAGCSQSLVCHCPFVASGPGWCEKTPTTPAPGECSCPYSVPCGGYCLPDGAAPGTNPVRCDGGT